MAARRLDIAEAGAMAIVIAVAMQAVALAEALSTTPYVLTAAGERRQRVAAGHLATAAAMLAGVVTVAMAVTAAVAWAIGTSLLQGCLAAAYVFALTVLGAARRAEYVHGSGKWAAAASWIALGAASTLLLTEVGSLDAVLAVTVGALVAGCVVASTAVVRQVLRLPVCEATPEPARTRFAHNLRAGGLLVFVAALSAVGVQGVTLVMGGAFGPEAAAEYRAAWTIVGVGNVALLAMMQHAQPVVAAAPATRTYLEWSLRTCASLAAGAIALAALGAAFAPWLLSAIFGAEYASADGMVRTLAVFYAVQVLVAVATIAVRASGGFVELARSQLAATGVLVISGGLLAVWFGPIGLVLALPLASATQLAILTSSSSTSRNTPRPTPHTGFDS